MHTHTPLHLCHAVTPIPVDLHIKVFFAGNAHVAFQLLVSLEKYINKGERGSASTAAQRRQLCSDKQQKNKSVRFQGFALNSPEGSGETITKTSKEKIIWIFLGFHFLAVIMYNNIFMFILPIKTHCLVSGTSLRSLILYQEILLVQDFYVKVEITPHNLVSCLTI